MNNQSSLIPQGSNLEQKNKGRARVKIAVFFVLAVHGIGLLALLVQGCQNDRKTSAQNENTNNVAQPPQFESTNPPAMAENSTSVTPTNPVPVIENTIAAATAAEYTIATGDTFTTIGKKFHLSAKAIGDANPGVEATKLRVGQKIHIPSGPAAAPSSGATTVASSGGSGDQMYTVKSGDTLSTIAKHYATTIRAIRAANNLTTDRITVGQKLKLPKGSAAAPVATAFNDTSSSTPAATAPTASQPH